MYVCTYACVCVCTDNEHTDFKAQDFTTFSCQNLMGLTQNRKGIFNNIY